MEDGVRITAHLLEFQEEEGKWCLRRKGLIRFRDHRESQAGRHKVTSS